MQLTSARGAVANLTTADDATAWPASPTAIERPWGLKPIDALAAPIDVLAYVLADDALSSAAKIGILEQWRYDLLQLQVAADEGLDGTHEDGCLLQLISKTLTRLCRRTRH
jgi:hypothetical protein